MRRVIASCPGSCGEIFQSLYQGQEILVSLGVNLYSWVLCQESPTGQCLWPRQQELVQLGTWGDLIPAHMQRFSQLPVAKGCASSTADLLAVAQAQFLWRADEASAGKLTSLCCQIEASDSVAFESWTVIQPLTGRVFWQTDWKPDFWILMLEPKEEVVTGQMIRMSQDVRYSQEASERLLDEFQKACQNQDLSALGQVAIHSALLNDQRLPKPFLSDLISFVEEWGLLGLNVAHSGSVLGLWISKEETARIPLLEAALDRLPLTSYYQKRSLLQPVYTGVRGEML
ncbi:kinase [Streptococcus danieliae]|uniref:Kinase n=2 Tax=Streptococcus danieliae TaxID=747656 RepID=A0A7X3G968_9STRE|nr:kinase [Streptococcus danieliae]